jgi:hypothetical protein
MHPKAHERNDMARMSWAALGCSGLSVGGALLAGMMAAAAADMGDRDPVMVVLAYMGVSSGVLFVGVAAIVSALERIEGAVRELRDELASGPGGTG